MREPPLDNAVVFATFSLQVGKSWWGWAEVPRHREMAERYFDPESNYSH